LKEVRHTEKSVSTAGASSSGFRNHVQQKHNTSDIAIIDDEEEEDCVEVDYNNQRMDKNVDEITSRLKKHHIDNKKPLIKYLEDVPALPNGNPFGNVNSKHLLPPREKQQGIFSVQKVMFSSQPNYWQTLLRICQCQMMTSQISFNQKNYELICIHIKFMEVFG
jgi:hypothetical protein